ncbi:MAG: FtsX-like permease family protein, partial [Gemmatimonadota bacterium]
TVLERVRAVAGVDAAGAVHILPMSGSNWNPSLAVRGQTPDTEPREVYWRIATPGYFQAVGIPLIRGRYVDERDVASAEPVAVINETLANVVFPGEDPVGREIRTGFEADGTWARVVGVVGDTRDMALDQTIMPQMYRPHEQWPIASLTLMVHSDGDAMQLLPALRRAIWSVHDQVPISETQAFDDVVASSATQPRLLAAILGSLSGLAIVLGAIGVYGVLAYTVEQRRREFGIRMALGATRSQVLRLVFVAAIRLAAVGIAFGALGALATSQLLTAHLYQTSPLDPRALLIAIAALSTAAAIAAWIPARRATRVSPGECMAAD